MNATGRTLRTRSAKMRRLMVLRRAVVRTMLAEFPACEAKLPGCTGRSTEVHELLSRARGGSVLAVDNLAALCHLCHHKVTVHAPGTERWRLSAPPKGTP